MRTTACATHSLTSLQKERSEWKGSAVRMGSRVNERVSWGLSDEGWASPHVAVAAQRTNAPRSTRTHHIWSSTPSPCCRAGPDSPCRCWRSLARADRSGCSPQAGTRASKGMSRVLDKRSCPWPLRFDPEDTYSEPYKGFHTSGSEVSFLLADRRGLFQDLAEHGRFENPLRLPRSAKAP